MRMISLFPLLILTCVLLVTILHLLLLLLLLLTSPSQVFQQGQLVYLLALLDLFHIHKVPVPLDINTYQGKENYLSVQILYLYNYKYTIVNNVSPYLAISGREFVNNWILV